MKLTLSLKWVIGVGASLVLVVSLFVYVHAVSSFSRHTLDYVVSRMIEGEAMYFAQRYEKDPLTPLPHGFAFSAVIGKDALPAPLRTLLQTPPSRVIGTVQVFDHPETTHIQAQRLYDGKTLYLFESPRDEDARDETRPSDNYWESKFLDLLLIGLSVPAVALMVIIFLVYRVVSPLHRLTQWSQRLGKPSSEPTARPGFCYTEFNLLASSLSESVSSVKAATLREERLLRYTSHELRTPLTVLKANLQLLEARGELSCALLRIQRSVRDMQGITETLLWMSSEQSKSLLATKVNMAQLLDELVEDNRYLINSRHLTLTMDVEDAPYRLPPNACRIVIGNLLRNALQYADQGCIQIACNTQTFTLVNHIAGTPEEAESADYGYGLGLELVQLLCEKLGWHLHQHKEGHYFTVRLMFAQRSP